jgi:hypothetical protein
MRKIQSLRAALIAAIPELANDYDRLRVWVDRGRGQGRQTVTDGFTMAFRLNVLAIEVVTDLSLIALCILQWLRTNQPELLQPAADSFTFDADILDDTTSDVLIQIELTQNYVVTTGDGGEMVEPLEQADTVLEDYTGFAGTDPTPDITAILMDGFQIAPPVTD